MGEVRRHRRLARITKFIRLQPGTMGLSWIRKSRRVVPSREKAEQLAAQPFTPETSADPLKVTGRKIRGLDDGQAGHGRHAAPKPGSLRGAGRKAYPDSDGRGPPSHFRFPTIGTGEDAHEWADPVQRRLPPAPRTSSTATAWMRFGMESSQHDPAIRKFRDLPGGITKGPWNGSSTTFDRHGKFPARRFTGLMIPAEATAASRDPGVCSIAVETHGSRWKMPVRTLPCSTNSTVLR